ncbi:unnamed protein product, partial [Sphacelaria rigidula]
YNQFNKLWYFKLDERGATRKEWILTEDDLLHMLLMLLKTEKRLTVSKVVDYVNTKLFTNTGVQERDREDDQQPESSSSLAGAGSGQHDQQSESSTSLAGAGSGKYDQQRESSTPLAGAGSGRRPTTGVFCIT